MSTENGAGSHAGTADWFANRFRHDTDALAKRLSALARTLEGHDDIDSILERAGENAPRTFHDVREGFRAVAEELVRPYKLMVTGVQNSGKSTLLNALLGEWILVAESRNVDAVLTRILYGETRGGVIHRLDGTRIETTVEDIQELLQQKSTHRAEEQARTDHCELVLPNENLLTFQFVNTPGLNDRPEVSRRTEEFFRHADGILWVFDAARIEERRISGNVLELCRAHGRKIIAVINRIDEVERMGGKDALALIEEQFRKLFEGCYEHHFLFNAKAASIGLGIHPSARRYSTEQREELLNESGYPALIDHFETSYFGQDKRQEKLDAAQARLDAGVQQGEERISLLTGTLEDRIAASGESESDINRLLNQVRRQQRRVDRKLFAIAEKHCGILIDAHLAVLDGVAEEVIGLRALVKRGETLANEFQQALEEAVEKRLPKSKFEERLAWDVEAMILEEWMEFADQAGSQLQIEFDEEISLPGLDAPIRIRGGIGPAITVILKAVMTQLLKAAGQRLSRDGFKRLLQLAVRKVLEKILKSVAKRVTVTLMRQFAKYINPVLWLLVLADIKKFREEIAAALAKARADVRFEMESQRALFAADLHDVLREANAKIAGPIEAGLGARLRQAGSKRDEAETMKARLAALSERIEDILETAEAEEPAEEPSGSGRRAADSLFDE